MLNKEIADMKARYQNEHDRTIQEQIRQDYESIENFIQRKIFRVIDKSAFCVRIYCNGN